MDRGAWRASPWGLKESAEQSAQQSTGVQPHAQQAPSKSFREDADKTLEVGDMVDGEELRAEDGGSWGPFEALASSVVVAVPAGGLMSLPLVLEHAGQWCKGPAWLRGKRRSFFSDLPQGPFWPLCSHLSNGDGSCLKNQMSSYEEEYCDRIQCVIIQGQRQGSSKWAGPGLGGAGVTPSAARCCRPADFGLESECLLGCYSSGPHSLAPSLGPGDESCP